MMEGAQNSREKPRRPGPEPLPVFLARTFFDMASQMFGGRTDRTGWDAETHDAAPAPSPGTEAQRPTEDPTAQAAEVLEQALTKAEALLEQMENTARQQAAPEGNAPSMDELTEVRHDLRDLARRLEDALAHLDAERQRLSDEASRLSNEASRLELLAGRLQAMLAAGPSPAPAPEAPPPVAPGEPHFLPGNGPLKVVVSAVPGFQGLMDTQRGLAALPGVASASVQMYRNGEATLEAVLRDALSPARVVEALSVATSHQLLIEEARPEAQRLRLRFIEPARASA